MAIFNTAALTVPGLYVQIVTPTNTIINGSPTNILGLVGTATWGPVGAPVVVGSLAQYTLKFGNYQTTKYDMGTHVAAATLQGANNLLCVRVTDGTDAAASGVIADTSSATGLTLTAFYTGSLGNSITATLSKGSSYTSSVPTYKITISLPGAVPEIFDNIGGTGATFWANAASAINLGQSNFRGPSQLITAAVASSSTAPGLASVTLTSGVDGNATITSTVLVGTDTLPRKGMYSLRSSGASVVDLCDADDTTQWAAQVSYGLSEGSYMIMVGPAGQSPTTAVAAKQTAGINSYAAKLLLGDWCYWQDQVNNQLRLISPQSFVAGAIAAQPPQESSLNLQLFGIVGTQKTYGTNLTYTSADYQTIASGCLDVVSNPSPGGSYFACEFGRNTSSNPVINGDNYTRMTNFLAASIQAALGIYIGQLQSATTRLAAKTALQSFLSNLQLLGFIGNASGTNAFSVTLDNTNNPPDRVALGYMQADIAVTYLSVISYFIVNIQGGQSVEIQPVQSNPVTFNI